MYFSSVAEYAAEIALTQASIRKTLESQKYGLSKGGVATESQRVTLAELRSYLKELIGERDSLSSTESAPVTRMYAKPGRRS